MIRGNIIHHNAQTGIQLLAYDSDPSMIVDNLISNNGVWAIDGNAAYSNNVINGNGSGTTQNATPWGVNFCNGNTTCP